jgi:magnesium-protoporphyrin O-methyltransferase
LEGIRKNPIPSAEVLDIGCGVGALHLALLKEGAVRATGIDAAEGMVAQARTIAGEQGFQHQTRYVVGDFVEKANQLPPADIVMLDKVVCCYGDLDGLISGSLEKARRLLALSRPRSILLVQCVFAVQIFFARLFRAAFRPYWHDWAQMEGLILAGGFKPFYTNSTFLWTVAVYQRL